MFSIYINKNSFLHNVPDGHPERVDRFYVLKEMINSFILKLQSFFISLKISFVQIFFHIPIAPNI